MAGHTFEALFTPISEDNPCGVDLEMEGDAEFMRFQAQIEGVLPASYAGFDRKEAALGGHIAKASALLKRTADLRIACALAKLAILDGDFPGFVVCVNGIGTWLETRWPELYPALLDGDPVLRLIDLTSLDDNPHAVLPLQSAPLFKSRRLGPVSLRSYLLAEGVVQPRSGFDDDDNAEKVPTTSELTGCLREYELADVMTVRGHAEQLLKGIDKIEAAVAAQIGPGSFQLPALRATAQQLAATVNKVAVAKDPSLAVSAVVADEADEAGGYQPEAVTGTIGSVTSGEALVRALQASAAYFARHEPSSPVRLLLVQAEALIGKSFFEALSVLAPEMATQANIRPGRGLAVTLPLERLAQLLPAAEDDVGGWQADDDASGGGWSGDETVEEADDAEAAIDEEAAGDEEAVTDAEGDGEGSTADNEADSAPVPTPARRAPAPSAFAARTRQEALVLLESAAMYLRQTEPSSPIPFILDHAKSMAGRDFVALLRELLPANVLSVDEE